MGVSKVIGPWSVGTVEFHAGRWYRACNGEVCGLLLRLQILVLVFNFWSTAERELDGIWGALSRSTNRQHRSVSWDSARLSVFSQPFYRLLMCVLSSSAGRGGLRCRCAWPFVAFGQPFCLFASMIVAGDVEKNTQI